MRVLTSAIVATALQAALWGQADSTSHDLGSDNVEARAGASSAGAHATRAGVLDATDTLTGAFVTKRRYFGQDSTPVVSVEQLDGTVVRRTRHLATGSEEPWYRVDSESLEMLITARGKDIAYEERRGLSCVLRVDDEGLLSFEYGEAPDGLVATRRAVRRGDELWVNAVAVESEGLEGTLKLLKSGDRQPVPGSLVIRLSGFVDEITATVLVVEVTPNNEGYVPMVQVLSDGETRIFSGRPTSDGLLMKEEEDEN